MLAQTAHDGVGLPDIVVTARKREERLQDVPISVSVFERSAIERDGIFGVDSLLQRVPGATFAITGPAFSREVMMRGVGSGRGINAEPAVGYYRDGFYSVGGNLGGRALNRMDLFDVERIEVLRGPQGGLLGRNALGGAINVIGMAPQRETGGTAVLMLADNRRREAEAVANLAPSDAVALRLGLLAVRQGGGIFRNADDSVLDDESFTGARAAIRLQPQHTLLLTATVEHFEEDGPSFAVFAYNQLLPGSARFRRNMNTPSRFHRRVSSATLHVEADLGAARLVSGTMLRHRRADTDDDFDAWNAVTNPLLINWRRQSHDRFRRFGQDLRFVGNRNSRFTWMLGGEFLTLDGSFDMPITGAEGAAQSQNSRSYTRSRDSSVAIYATADIELGEGLRLSGEARSTWDRKRFDGEATSTSSAGMPMIRSFGFERTFRKFSPGVTLGYSPSDNASVYLRYATGFRAGGFNSEPDPLIPERFPIAYQPETASSLEAGGRMLALDNRLRFAVSAYRMETDDLLVPISYPVSGGGAVRNISALRNIGHSRQSGLELEVDAGLVRGRRGGTFDVRLALGHGWGHIQEGPFAGQPVPRLRELTVAGEANWRQPLGHGLALSAGASLRSEYGGWQGTTDVPLDDIRQLDLRLGLEGQSWQVTAMIDNAADRLFDGDRNLRDPATGLFRQVYTTGPRRFSVRARMQF